MAMEQRTLNIIHICKGGTKYNQCNDDILTSIKKYMADECAYNADWYSDKDMYDIMWTAMQDYLDNCDKPSNFMRQLKGLIYAGPNITHAIIVALSLMRVRDKDKGYVNGFDDRLNKLDIVNDDEGECGRCMLNGNCPGYYAGCFDAVNEDFCES